MTALTVRDHNTPPAVIRKAERLLDEFLQGTRYPIRLPYNGPEHLKINVTPRWRLLSKDNGRHWHLLNHHHYDRERKSRPAPPTK